MSLLDSEKRLCCRVIKASVPDGHGAQVTRYVDTRVFQAVFSPDMSMSGEKEIGGRNISAKRYKVLYPENVVLSLDDVIRTRKDNKTYKVTSDGNPPANASTIRKNFVYVEEWSVPDE